MNGSVRTNAFIMIRILLAARVVDSDSQHAFHRPPPAADRLLFTTACTPVSAMVGQKKMRTHLLRPSGSKSTDRSLCLKLSPIHAAFSQPILVGIRNVMIFTDWRAAKARIFVAHDDTWQVRDVVLSLFALPCIAVSRDVLRDDALRHISSAD